VGHHLQPVDGEEMLPISSNPRPQAPGYVRMPGRPKKNDRRREEQEKPKSKKMSKHGIVIICSMCGNSGHNKAGCKNNPERGKKKYAHLTKKKKTTEVIYAIFTTQLIFCHLSDCACILMISREYSDFPPFI
jgi:hypothetical protein